MNGNDRTLADLMIGLWWQFMYTEEDKAELENLWPYCIAARIMYDMAGISGIAGDDN